MKVAISEKLEVTVEDAGDGKWIVLRELACGSELTGFGGENHLYIFIEGWQSGDCYVTICHCMVDSSPTIRTGLFKQDVLTAGVNDLITQTSGYSL